MSTTGSPRCTSWLSLTYSFVTRPAACAAIWLALPSMKASSVVSWRRVSISTMVPITISATITTMATSTTTGRFHSGGLPSSSFFSGSSFLSS